MSQSTTSRPVWVDLGSQDAAGSRAFYSALFGWVAEPSPDPQFGGYAVATLGGKDVAGIGPAQSPEQPTAWSLYIGTSDADGLAARIAAHGGAVIAPPFPVGDMGRMAVFRTRRCLHLRLGDRRHGRLRGLRAWVVRVGGAQRPGRDRGPRVLPGRLRLDAHGVQRHARWRRLHRAV